MTDQLGLPKYDAAQNFPPRVWQAVEATRAGNFALACLPEAGRLLQLCAGLSGISRICELGTAYGIGAAWIESGMRPGATLLTIEHDAERARVAGGIFADNPAIEVAHGDWSLALERAPFDMLFSDSGVKRGRGDPDRLLPLLKPGALLVLDDFTPGLSGDAAREMWLGHDAYDAVMVTLSDDAAAILARKRAAAAPAAPQGSRSGPERG